MLVQRFHFHDAGDVLRIVNAFRDTNAEVAPVSGLAGPTSCGRPRTGLRGHRGAGSLSAARAPVGQLSALPSVLPAGQPGVVDTEPATARRDDDPASMAWSTRSSGPVYRRTRPLGTGPGQRSVPT